MERLLRERQAAAEQGCRGPPAPYHRWRDDDDVTDGDDIAAGQRGHVYEVVVRYKLLLFLVFSKTAEISVVLCKL